VTVLSVTGLPASGATRRAATIAPGTVLTNTTLGGYSQIDQIDMLSPRLGYALATGSLGHDRYAYYLVRTTNLGKSWTVQSEIAANLERYPIFSDYNLGHNNSSIDFVSVRVGYVDGAGGSLDVTSNAGRTWSQITPANSSTSYAVNGATTSVVVTMCPSGATTTTSTCKSEFELYPTGSTRPIYSTGVQVPSKYYEPIVELLAAAPHGIDVLNVDAGNFTTATSLRISHDNGRSWAPMANPCATLAIEQLLVATNGTWILSCFRDEGMSQGPGRILRSTNDGRSWSTELNYPGYRPGKPYRPDSPMSLVFSGNDRLLYGVILNPAGGLSVSSNYGRTWTAERFFGYTGGAPGSVTNFGPTSSLYQVFQGPAFVTRDSRSWKLLPQLSAGRYRNASICTSPDTRVRWRSHVVAGLRYTYLDFNNSGTHACYLNGMPSIQPRSSRGRAVGPPITGESSAAGGGFVLLRANGGVANVSVMINPVSGYRPVSNCAPAKASALLINFAPPSLFKYRLGVHDFYVCTTMPNVLLRQVMRGRGRP
jgi:hypothetical protein